MNHNWQWLCTAHRQDWSSMNSIVTPAVRRGFWAAFRDFNWEACSRFLMVCTDTRLPWRPTYRICRLRAVMRRFLKVARRIERSTLESLWWYVVSHFLAYPSRHVYPCIGAAIWIWYSDRHRRLPQHPVASIQPLNGQCLLPDPHWTTSLSLLTNMLKFRSPLEHECKTVQFDSLWVTIEFIDDQSCLWAVAHYWHWEILLNFCGTPPLFSGFSPAKTWFRTFGAEFACNGWHTWLHW